jgi:hypothetical protein
MRKKKVTVNDIKVVSGWDYKVYKRAKRHYERTQRKLARKEKFIDKMNKNGLGSVLPSMGFVGWMILIAVVAGFVLSLM